jgi:hypothetical protein
MANAGKDTNGSQVHTLLFVLLLLFFGKRMGIDDLIT